MRPREVRPAVPGKVFRKLEHASTVTLALKIFSDGHAPKHGLVVG